MNVSLDIQDNATPAIDRLQKLVGSRGLRRAMADGVATLVRQHLRAKEQEPNKMGAPKTHFYEQAADATHVREEGGQTVVAISKIGMRQRYFGGPINPVKANVLTIPVSKAAYGHTAGEFKLGLILFKEPKGKTVGLLVRSGGGPEAEVMYRLVRSVTQAADPSVLPTEEEMAEAAVNRVKALIGTL